MSCPYQYFFAVEKIIHSKSYARYTDKTQVVYLVDNDHITQRSLHVQYVSAFARQLAYNLNLDASLTEAIALGHDVGHPPFGHEGEGYLSELSLLFGGGHFTHPLQSCRLFNFIEPLQLPLEVYDGFLCHDGGLTTPVLKPHFEKTEDDYLEECLQKKKNPDTSLIPMTLEGCLVKISDTISYTSRDLEDAIRLKIVKREDVPHTILGSNNFEILHFLMNDITKCSRGKKEIVLSQEAFEALKTLREFNFNHIYHFPPLKQHSEKIRQGYRILFESFLKNLREKGKDSYVFKEFASSKPLAYHTTSDVEMVVDYIAGMTDHFFLKQLKSLVLPSTIPIHEIRGEDGQ